MTLGVPRERPTAAFTVRDLSASPGRASAPPEGRPLHEVVARWTGRPAVEDCCCGGEIRAESAVDADVVTAVRQHQVEPVHIAWDRAHGNPLASWQVSAAAIDAIGVR